MSEDMNNNILDEEEGVIELVDDDGNVVRFEFIDTVEYNGTIYYALVPEIADDQDDAEGTDEFVVLKEVEQDGQYMLTTVDSDEEYQEIGELFLRRFAELADYDEEEEE